MNIKIWTLIFFTSLVSTVTAAEDTQSAKAGQTSSLRVREFPQTLLAEWVSIIDGLEEENALLRTQLWEESSYLWVPPAPKSLERPKGLDYEDPSFYKGTGVEFVQKIFADLSNTLMSPIDELEQESQALNQMVRLYSQPQKQQQIGSRYRAYEEKSKAALLSNEFQMLMAFVMNDASPLILNPALGSYVALLRARIESSKSKDMITLRKVLRPVHSPLDVRNIPSYLDTLLGKFKDQDILFTYGADEAMTVGKLRGKVDNYFKRIPLDYFFKSKHDQNTYEYLLKEAPKLISLGAILLENDDIYLSILDYCEKDFRVLVGHIESLPYFRERQAI
jgi:hypothetical protein